MAAIEPMIGTARRQGEAVRRNVDIRRTPLTNGRRWEAIGSALRRRPGSTVRRDRHDHAAMTLVPGDPLAHRALDSLLRAEASVRRRLSADIGREGLSASGFSVLVVLTTAGGELELRALRRRLRTSKANATEVVTTLEARGLVSRTRLLHDKRAAAVTLTALGQELVDRLFPEHTERVRTAFAVLDEAEKRQLADICRKLAA
jgi:MarR family transcriptional regulator, 2-MHQ and catechol-resistance regulon repressor